MNNWIWLDSKLYPQYEKNDDQASFCIAEFKNHYYAKDKTKIQISADARYLLFVNDKFIGRGPASPGSDFLYGKMTYSYIDEYEIIDTGKVEIRILVTNVSTALTEYTFGYSGLFVRVTKGEEVLLEGNESWDSRPLTERKSANYTDYTVPQAQYHKAKFIPTKRQAEHCPLEKLTEEKILPIDFAPVTIGAKEKQILSWQFDKIYSAYPQISIEANSNVTIKMISSEQGKTGYYDEVIVTDKKIEHICPRMRSVGEITLEIENKGECACTIKELFLNYAHYPVKNEAKFKCSDKLLNEIYDLCMHTQKICRQTLHLDSPTHQEHLACTGDYYIQALIEYYNMYDPTLTEFDILRTSRILEAQNGRLFHTSYSLIYPLWIYDYYMHTGNLDLLKKVENSLRLLTKRFEGYVAEDNGLIEYAPDYMFVDWVIASENEDSFLDGSKMMSHGKMTGFSLHHPPKALGQSVLCMLYYEALNKLSAIFSLLKDEKTSKECLKKAKKIKNAINESLFDKQRGLYVGGLNTPDRVETGTWLPQNTKTVYYLKQANVLSVLFGIAPQESSKSILEYVLKDLSKYEMQPYFYHFLLESIYKTGLFEKYGLDLIRKYESLLKRCKKGLSEAWENMDCDFSHAWGAAPAYILKKALTGFEILEAGYKKIKLKPRLYDLESMAVEISTPFGNIEICQQRGKEPIIKSPREIEII
ncbi:MAG: hypothetical protein IJ400_03465 [Clostridia bacterium]|nr:hypothetical protein [Clostridia bacterium]